MKSWIYLLLAIVFEVMGTTSMKYSEGFTKLTPSILIFIFYGIAFTFLTLCLKTINLSIAYAIWAGLGTALIAIIGIFAFHEPVNALKVLFLTMIIVGVMGLKVSSAA